LRHFLLSIAALVAFGATPALGQSDTVLDRIVANARARIGVVNEGGWTITGARAEGRTLVLEVNETAEMYGMFTPEDLTQIIAIVMCQSTDGRFFSDGHVLSVEASGPGAAAARADFRVCPTTTLSDMLLRGTARAVRATIGLRSGPARLSAVQVEGNSLVVTFDGGIGWRRTYSVERVSTDFFTGFCQGPDPALLREGRTIRLDTLENGANRQRGEPVSSCAAYYHAR
jgi:hypothetical protein